MSSELSHLKGKLALAGSKQYKSKFDKKGAAGGGGAKLKNKKSGFNKSQQKEDEKWKKVPPKDGEPNTKTVKGKHWTWCIHHMAWGNHSVNECRLGKKRTTGFVANSANMADIGTTAASSAISQGLAYMATIANVAARDE
jgi:hypothetical protein